MSLEFNEAITPGNYVVDDIGAIVSKIRERWITADTTRIKASSTRVRTDGSGAPYFEYGHKLEVAKKLMLSSKSQSFQKYPMVYLVMDFPETKTKGVLTCTLNIGLIAFTKEDYPVATRYTEVFKKTLYPLYHKFFEELFQSGLFFWDGKENQVWPDHTKIDRPFWGNDGEQSQTGQKKNKGYIFNADALDCIEIVGLKLNQHIKS
jgi:hypothetical protein